MSKIQTVRFQPKSEFYTVLQKKVNSYFTENNISKNGNMNMYFKTLFMFTLFFGPYVLMLINPVSSPWFMISMYAVMGFGVSGLGLSVMHDANHDSYSKYRSVNTILSQTANLIGGHSQNWRIQHNLLHHSFTNIQGLDGDISSHSILRFSPNSKWMGIHRFQFLYTWFLYGLMTISWALVTDYRRVVEYSKKGLLKTQKTTFGRELVKITIWRIVYFGYTVVLPILVLPFAWWQIIIGFFIMHYIAGLMLALIFQTAHVVHGSEFPLSDETGTMENNWAVHQMKTTANYSPNSRIFTWFIGGLNYQIEHHLFPNICHVHYRKISEIVKNTAEEFKLPYHSYRTFMAALGSHARMVWDLGKRPQTA